MIVTGFLIGASATGIALFSLGTLGGIAYKILLMGL